MERQQHIGTDQHNVPARRVSLEDLNVGDLNLSPATMQVMPSGEPRQYPPIAGGTPADQQPGTTIANLQILLTKQQQLYGSGEQPPVQVQHQPYNGPPLRYLVSNRPVRYVPVYLPGFPDILKGSL